MPKNQLVIYIDMDDTLCNYEEGFKLQQSLHPDLQYPQSAPGFFLNLPEMHKGVETYKWLECQPELKVYILTAPSTMNPHSYSEKRLWVEKHLGFESVDNLIISAHKGLNKGQFLIDDSINGRGQEHFEGELIQFGSLRFPNWETIRKHFEKVIQSTRKQ